jgi:hypothetical protein
MRTLTLSWAGAGAKIDLVLEMKPNCEHCGRELSLTAADAMICSFECTFCATCVQGVLAGACPNCGGPFERRPARAATS